MPARPNSGPKRTPLAVRKLNGAPEYKLNMDEPKWTEGVPAAPLELCEEARTEWDRVVHELYHMGVLTRVDSATLFAYCDSFARVVFSERLIQHEARTNPKYLGLMIIGRSGLRINPAVNISRQARQDMVRYAAELGMTPSARTRFVVPSKEDKNPAESYFDMENDDTKNAAD